MEVLTADIAELKKLHETATRTNVRSALQTLIQTEEVKLNKLEKEKKAVSSNQAGVLLDETCRVDRDAGNVRDFSDQVFSNLNKYSYDQGKAYIKIYCDLKDLHLSPDCDCTFTRDGFHFFAIGVPDGKGKLINYQMKVTDLCEDINPDKSSLIRKDDKFVIRLQKSETGIEWSGIDTSEKKKKAQHSRLADGGASTEELLANMYKNATDEQRADLSKAAFEGQSKRMEEQKKK